MDDLISRQAAIDAICECGIYEERKGRLSMPMEIVKHWAADVLVDIPSARPERKRGTWIAINKGERGYSVSDFRCLECGRACPCYHLTRFCPNCGAEMMEARAVISRKEDTDGDK